MIKMIYMLEKKKKQFNILENIIDIIYRNNNIEYLLIFAIICFILYGVILLTIGFIVSP